jgi:hypothetical protein
MAVTDAVAPITRGQNIIPQQTVLPSHNLSANIEHF